MTSKSLMERAANFSSANKDSLEKIWLAGDVHGEFKYLARALAKASPAPKWIILLGDVDIRVKSLREYLAPLQKQHPEVKFFFIHGNHDADTARSWQMLHDCGSAIPLHGRVVSMGRVTVAGLGGTFLERVWVPPAEPIVSSRADIFRHDALHWGKDRRLMPKVHGAIYLDEYRALAGQRADILVTHEAPSCHPYGSPAIDALAQGLGAIRSFHGHHHDDPSFEYAKQHESLGFEALAVGFRALKNGLGHIVDQDGQWLNPTRPLATP